jgi:arabinogalactan oligomer/maltooligosaccharide transport system permease protein
VTSATAPTAQLPSRSRRADWLPRLVSALSGTTGFVIKVALLAISNALAVWAVYVLATRHNWVAVVVLLAVTALIDVVYLVPRRWTIPLKFLVPGTLLLIAFQVIPIIYTIDVAFTNYSTGHILTKGQAIQGIELNSLQQPPNGRIYTMAVAKAGGGYVLILQDQATGKFYTGTKQGLTPLPAGSAKSSGGQIVSAKGFKLLSGIALFNAVDGPLQKLVVPVGHGAGVRAQSTTQAVELEPTLRYDRRRDVFVNLNTGAVYRDNGNGEFAHGSATPLQPGWKTYVGTKNFSAIIHDPTVRHPFLRVFAWTFVFAAGTVFFSFAIGLFLAISLDKRGMRFQRFYRTVLIIPWAIPGFLSLLVWAGLLNDQFGVVNRIFHLSVPWLFDANWARVSCILVSTWLTVPYFFVVSMGALQAIPEELVEAARVDGGGPFQIFRRITLPLLLVAVGPLLVASFAFNFNNFNNIYLLTRGGPTFTGGNGVAGATDILISYTYKVAIASGLGNNYGLASAITIIIFLITAGLSAIGFSRTAVLEERV